MECKTFEIRDVATFIPALAIQLEPCCEQDRYLFARAGFGSGFDEQRKFIWLSNLEQCPSGTYDPYDWSSGTMKTAHDYMMENWGSLQSGSVIDVEFILGRSNAPKKSEAEIV